MPESNAPDYNPVIGYGIVDRALSWVNVANYTPNSNAPNAFDCSGFVSYAVTGLYEAEYKRWSTYYMQNETLFPSVTSPQPGDIAMKSDNSHCGIYLGNNLMVHAPEENTMVAIGEVQSNYYFRRYAGGQ